MDGDFNFTFEEISLIDTLQSKITKTELQCIQERRNYIDLLGKHEQGKLENKDLKRNFQAALLLGNIDEKAVVHFLQNNPRAPELTDKIIRLTEELKKCDGDKVDKNELKNPLLLVKQVKALKSHLKELKEQHFVEVFALQTALKQGQEQWDIIKSQFEVRLKDSASRLEEVRLMLHRSNEENLQLKKTLMTAEDDWSKEHRKLLNQLGTSELPSNGNFNDLDGATQHPHGRKEGLERQLLEKLTRSELQLIEKDIVIKEYELKFLQLERKLNRATELEMQTKLTCSETIGKLKDKNDILESRFDRLDERRKLDNEGFHSDVKGLKGLLARIQKKLHLFMNRREREDQKQRELEEAEKEMEAKRPSTTGNVKPLKSVIIPRPKSRKKKPKEGLNKERKIPAEDEVNEVTKERKMDPEKRQSEIEKDRLIFAMIYKLVNSATDQVNSLQKRLPKNRNSTPIPNY